MLNKIIFCFYFLIAATSNGQNSLPVQFSQFPSRNTQIGSFTKNGVLYGSLGDLSHVFNFKTLINNETEKFEIHADEYTLKITANNPYVIIVDKKENANLIQLPVSVIYAANSYFAPLNAFIPILKRISTEEIIFDGNKISIGRIVPKSSFDITGLSFEQMSNGSLVRIHCSKKLDDFENWSKQIGDDTWLYITLADARADIEAIKRTSPSGIVKQILAFQSPTSVQLTLRIKGQVNSTEVIPAEGSNDILVAIHPPTEEQVEIRKARDYGRKLQLERDRWKLDVVVIDAGHGGDDPGALGVTGTREKDVTLAIASQLGKLIENKLSGVKAIYTRKKDDFIELYRRGQIANQNGGKLFISIHCNSMPRRNHSENGFEIYLLRPGKTENALKIAERENAVIKYEQGYEKRYQQLTEENFILLSMAQSAYVKYSEQFAEILQNEMVKYLNVANNGVKQAGFYVLVGASMPNVLIETGYLSNKHDEKILKSTGGQRRLAESIFNGVKRYKQEYEKSLGEGSTSGDGTK